MLSKEEKNSIEYLKARLYGNDGCKFIDVAQSDLRIILNLINKYQKEIKYLKGQIPQDKIFYYSEKDYISKDKIREKMREIMSYTFTTSEERHYQNYAYDRLKELLEE